MCADAVGQSYRLLVFGRVQGVGFRAYVRRCASGLGLRGYVRNLDDGSVEIVASGSREKIDDLVAKIRLAPAPIRVESISLKEEAFHKSFTDFVILR